jgi:N-glycosylase/DNA lyase
MYEIEIKDMDMNQIAVSGQCFRIRRQPDCDAVWSVTANGEYVEAVQQGNRFLFSCNQEVFDNHWSLYFDLSRDYGQIKKEIDPEDAYLQEAVKAGWGVRILRQDLWEMIVTFLISQNNNITRITNSVEALAVKFGQKKNSRGLIRYDGENWQETDREFYTFPDPQQIAQGGMEALQGLGLGYRDKYILDMAQFCSSQEGRNWLTQLLDCDYEESHKRLMTRYGIGRKVADCICLFGLHHVGAFPVDTHVKQIVAAYYPGGFPLDQYPGIAGILQQYMFYYKLNK